MNKPRTQKASQLKKAEVRWPVILLTPHGPIEAQSEQISPGSIVVNSQNYLPSDGDLSVLIKAPNNLVLSGAEVPAGH